MLIPAVLVTAQGFDHAVGSIALWGHEFTVRRQTAIAVVTAVKEQPSRG
jgi:hypothetical protein